MEDQFINRLKLLMETLHLVPGSFAGKLGIKPSVVYAWRDGRNKPGLELLQKISNVFAVNLNWMINGSGDMFAKNYLEGGAEQSLAAEDEAEYPNYKMLYEQALARIRLLERTIADKQEIINLLKKNQ